MPCAIFFVADLVRGDNACLFGGGVEESVWIVFSIVVATADLTVASICWVVVGSPPKLAPTRIDMTKGFLLHRRWQIGHIQDICVTFPNRTVGKLVSGESRVKQTEHGGIF